MEGLRELMRRRRWTQAEAAAELGLSQSQISRLLSGRSKKMRFKVAQRFANLRDVPAGGAEDDLAQTVVAAADADPDFRILLEAAIRMANRNA